MSQTKAQLLDGKSATIQFTGGSASVPSVSFTGDTNTGIYSPGADQVAVSTGGSGRLFVDASGRVGVGTSSPSVKLEVSDVTSSNPEIRVIDGTVNTQWYASDTGVCIFGTFSNHPQVFRTNGIERLRIDASGRLLVGTSSTSATLTALLQGNSASATSSAALQIARGEIPAVTGTVLGALDFSASNHVLASRILCKSDGAWTAGTSQPTRLEFFTTADGESSPTERMRIAANGQLTHSLNGTTNAANLTLSVGGVGDPGNTGWITPRIDFVGSSLASAGTTFIGATGGLGGRSLVFATGSDGAGSERVRIDSSGRLLVGTSSGSYKFQINALGSAGFAFDDTAAAITGTFGTGGNLTLRAQVVSSVGGGEIYLGGSTRGDSNINSIVLSTSNTERMRIGANGYIHASNTGSYYSTGTFHELSGNSATDSSLFVGSFNTSKNHGNISACLVVADYDSDYTDSNLFGGWNVTNNSWRILIRGDGDVENVNNSYGALSDAKLKENIVNAGSQWDDIKALQVRKYNFKEGQTHTQIGLIAQEVELVSPGLVSESPDRDEDGNDLGTVTKSVNYSVLYMKAVKALQEAMERIETLEAKVAALESV